MKRTGILILLLAGCLIHALGQETDRFHPDPTLFIQEAREFFGGQQPENTRALLSKYESAQKNGDLEENHWIDLARKANLLEKSGAGAIPDFYFLLETFIEVATHSKSTADYLLWSGYLDNLIPGSKKSLGPFRSFLDFTLNFSSRGVLYKSRAFEWRVNPGPVEFGMDSSFFVTVRQSNLIASGSGDSTIILSTGGRFYPQTNSFYGTGGQITWEKLGIEAGQVSVQLNRYTIDLTKSFFIIDTVSLIDKRYFTRPIPGRVENKILPGVPVETAGYPRFTSYELRNRIKNLYPGMDYEGGFSLQGLRVLGTGLPDQKSVLTIYNNQRPLMRLASTYFSFQPDQARGINAEASIYLETDSIYHPGLLFQFNRKLNEVSLIRDGQGLSPSRFLNTYHGFDLNVDWIRWHPGEAFISMTGLPGSTENKASFESSDYFTVERYNEILVADSKHPVAWVKQCADYYYSRNFTLEDISSFMDKPQHLVEEMLLRLSFLGFVRYNSENKMVEVEERTYDFLKKNAGQQDYDIIRFESSHPPPEVNAVLNLNDSHLKVYWVKSVEISQTRHVIIYPAQQTIELLKGRDILFDGEIQSGLVNFKGTRFRFNYSDFAIRLGKVDQMRLEVYEKITVPNQPPLRADVTSIIEDTRGTLKIDEPNNKSGLKSVDYPQYPIVQTDTNAYVYYDQKEILDGVYPRETFYFNISPFILSGLNLYTFADSLNFPGKFITADIFPPLELALRHQTDHSLGFETQKTPEEGYPVYKGKGRFYNSIAMSKAGLKGSGTLEYLNSTLVSEDFLFLPDQVNTVANMFAVNRDTTGAGNPETKGELMAIKWYPEKDKLVARGTKGPLNMYGNGQFDGELSLEPEALTGKGTISFNGYSVTSNELRFNENSFNVVSGDLKIFPDSTAQTPDAAKTDNPVDFLTAKKYDGLVDVAGREASFKPAGEDSRIDFTQNRYEGRPTGFKWDMPTGMLSMDDVQFNMATKPSDSLNFKSGQADFSVGDVAISAHAVEYIDVADVRVFPVDRNLVIRKDAQVDSLLQATIVSRDTSLVHRITSATVKLIDHKRYQAHGLYQYKDIAGREFSIEFSDIQPDRKGISIGKGTIEVADNFSLSPAFSYFGSVEWNNKERYLLFDGQTQLKHSCPDITLQWIRFSSLIFPDSVAIPIDSITKNDQGERLFKGFFLANQPVELYSTFIGPHTRYSDQPLISANGWLWYDEPTGQYKLASTEKRSDPDADGPMLRMLANECLTEAEGPLSMVVDLGQVKLAGAGKLIHDLRRDSLTGTVMLTTDFFFNDKVLDFMAKSINEAPGLEPINYGSPGFRNAFRDLVGRAKGEELLKEISLTGKWKNIPEELIHTLVFTDVNFIWNPATGSLQSSGKIGIANILEESINKKVNGHIEIMHRRGGDVLTMYIELDRQNYFFFSYSRGVMQCVAGPGQEKFNDLIRGTRESKRRVKTGPGETEYQYYIGTYAQVSEFLRKFNVDR